MPLRILLADDSMTAQKMGKDILTSAGYEVTTVSNGAAAAKKLADKHDIYILDIFMPGYSGIELCEKVRASADTSKTPVLLTVGKMEPFNQVDVQRVKADGVIIKPFEASDLLAAIKKFAEAKAAEVPAYEKTIIFRPPQVEEFKDQSYADWKSEAPEHVEELPSDAAPPPFVMSQEMAAAPAFMMSDPDATVDIPPAPAPTSLDDTVTSAPPAAPPIAAAAAAAAVPPTAFGMEFPAVSPASELTPVETRTVENLLSPSPIPTDFGMPPAVAAPAPAPVERPEVEFNSAPKAGPVEVVQEAGLEADSRDTEVVVFRDPSLVTDPTEIATEFVTKFGVESANIAEGEKGFVDSRPPVDSPAPAEIDDFEARVAAAMAGFGDEPAPVEEITTVAPIEEPVAPAPGVDDTQQMEAVVETEAEETPESQRLPDGMQDASLVEQMQAAFANLPVDTVTPEEPEPVSAPEPISAAPAPSGQDLELAKALAAAVGAEPPPTVATPASSAVDTNTATQVVNRVLERMLPAIMLELVKEWDATKKP